MKISIILHSSCIYSNISIDEISIVFKGFVLFLIIGILIHILKCPFQQPPYHASSDRACCVARQGSAWSYSVQMNIGNSHFLKIWQFHNQKREKFEYVKWFELVLLWYFTYRCHNCRRLVSCNLFFCWLTSGATLSQNWFSIYVIHRVVCRQCNWLAQRRTICILVWPLINIRSYNSALLERATGIWRTILSRRPTSRVWSQRRVANFCITRRRILAYN